MSETPQQGGVRPGAGRPKNPAKKRRMSTSLAVDVHDYLASRDAIAVTIEEAVRKTKEFREWRKQAE